MQEDIIGIFCTCDDFLKDVGVREDPQRRMSTAEVMTTALVAAWFFGGDVERSRRFMADHGYVRGMLGKSRLNRRLHQISEGLWQGLLHRIVSNRQGANREQLFVIDSYPVPACDNIRISRSRRFRGERYRGYLASKRRFFYGLRLHVVIDVTGCPTEFAIEPGSVGDITAMQRMAIDLPDGATLYADKAYTNYRLEDTMAEPEAGRLRLVAHRRANSKRPHPPYRTFLAETYRKRIETAFSLIAARLPKHIHAVTARGFELKAALFLIAFAVVRFGR